MAVDCLRCHTDKPDTEFKRNAQGHQLRWCNDCRREYKRAWRASPQGQASTAADREKNGKERGRRWREKNKERLKEIDRRSSRTYAQTHRDAIREKSRRMRRERPEVHHAHLLVQAMVFFGMMAREPCRECGAENAQAHHEDHFKPMEVVWLCRSCHARLHAKRSNHLQRLATARRGVRLTAGPAEQKRRHDVAASTTVEGVVATTPRGSRHGRSKLNEQVVVQMRQLAADGVSYSEIGRRVGVGHATARSVVLRLSWTHVP